MGKQATAALRTGADAPPAICATAGSKSAIRKVAAQRRRDLEAGGEHVKALMDKVEALGLLPKRPGIDEDLSDIRSATHIIRHELLAGFEHSNEAFREGFERGLAYLITGVANGGGAPEWSRWDPIKWTADAWHRTTPTAVGETAATGAEPSDSTSEPRPVVAGALVARDLVRTLAEAAPVPEDETGFGLDRRSWVLRDAVLDHTSRQQTPDDHEWGFWLGLAGFIVPNASGVHIDRDAFDPLRLMAEEDLIQPTADAAQLVQAMPKAKPPAGDRVPTELAGLSVDQVKRILQEIGAEAYALRCVLIASTEVPDSLCMIQTCIEKIGALADMPLDGAVFGHPSVWLIGGRSDDLTEANHV